MVRWEDLGSDEQISCGILLFSWVLVLVGLLPMFFYGHAGFFVGFIPLVGAQIIRAKHDKRQFERIRKQQLAVAIAAIYWFTLMIIAIVARSNGLKLDDVPVGVAALLFCFPLIAGAIFGDLYICRRKNRQK